MLLCVFATAENCKVLIFEVCQLRVATFSLQKITECAGDSGVFPYFFFFAVLNLVFELKQNLEAQPYPKMNS